MRICSAPGPLPRSFSATLPARPRVQLRTQPLEPPPSPSRLPPSPRSLATPCLAWKPARPRRSELASSRAAARPPASLWCPRASPPPTHPSLAPSTPPPPPPPPPGPCPLAPPCFGTVSASAALLLEPLSYRSFQLPRPPPFNTACLTATIALPHLAGHAAQHSSHIVHMSEQQQGGATEDFSSQWSEQVAGRGGVAQAGQAGQHWRDTCWYGAWLMRWRLGSLEEIMLACPFPCPFWHTSKACSPREHAGQQGSKVEGGVGREAAAGQHPLRARWEASRHRHTWQG